VPRAQPPPRLEPSLRSCDAHPHPHEAFSHLCGDQERSASRGASPRHCDRRSRHGALQRFSGSPSASGGILFTALRSPAAWSSSAAYWLWGGRGRGRGRGRKSGRGGPPGGRGHSPGGSQWPSFYNPWTGTIQMWPGPSAGTSAPRPATLSRFFLSLHLQRCPRHLPSLSRGSFPSQGLQPHTYGGPGPMGGTRSLSPTPSPQ
jgi:hypothetical protein